MTDLGPVVRSVVVRCPPGLAFEHYTARIDEWWPLRRLSILEDDATGVVFEQRAGGRIFETGPQGDLLWGTVIVWEPPARIVYTWHPGRPADRATEVEMVFAEHDDGTLVTVEHREWHRLGADATRSRDLYSGEKAWIFLLRTFKERLEGAPR